MLCALPHDVWALIAPHLEQKDIANLAMTCRSLSMAMDQAWAGISICVDQGRILDLPPAATDVYIDCRAMQKYGVAIPPPRMMDTADFGFLRRLQRLAMRHCRLPPVHGDGGFWSSVFASCPHLEDVQVMGDFYLCNYAHNVRHAMDLVTMGAPRLKRLDMEGGWLVMYPADVPNPDFPSIVEASRLAYSMPPVPSRVLQHYRAACMQVPMGVDAPLTSLEINEPQQPPLIIDKLGPLTFASTKHIVYKAPELVFDASRLGRFTALETARVRLVACRTGQFNNKLATLAGLPASLTSLTLDLDTWHMRYPGFEDAWNWASPLSHLTQLRDLTLNIYFVPSYQAGQLLGTWLGAGPSVRTVRLEVKRSLTSWCDDELARLQDEGATSDDESVQFIRDHRARCAHPAAAAELHAWLAAHPACTCELRGLTVATPHPRVDVQ